MTTPPQPLQSGQRVWVEAVVVSNRSSGDTMVSIPEAVASFSSWYRQQLRKALEECR